MKIELGQRIRELRRRDGRTQEALAQALGVTSQAVSRWEACGGYPDMDMIPAIANYFGITIDELFGYENDREKKIDEIIARVDAFSIKTRGDDEWVDECLAILREGLAEFPGNEKLLITLAETLSEAGWRRHCEWVCYDDEGYMQHSYDVHRKNPYWNEAVRICEQLAADTSDNAVFTRANDILVLLYRNFGKTEEATACAKRMPRMKYCREILLASAVDGKKEARRIGEFLIEAARLFSEQLVYGLVVNRKNYESDMPIEKIKGLIALYDLICDDGNYGTCSDELIKLYLYLSRLEWERGYHDEAFDSLDKALWHAKALERVLSEPEHRYTAPLVSFVTVKGGGKKVKIAQTLPDDWPFWCNPDCSEVEKEIKADPRRSDWTARTME